VAAKANKLPHPDGECCTRPDLLVWWVLFQEAWCRERLEVARAMYERGKALEHAEPYDPLLVQHVCGTANAIAQQATMRRAHAQRVANGHGVPWPEKEG
jgi:hypothetical protein